MQILGKKSKLLLIAVAIVMLVALGVSFAIWDTSAVKAANGELSQYANAKVGETVFFGNYYQTNQKDNNGEYVKTPIEWLVVDKDERTGQLTLMSKYILACGSYFGNYYRNLADKWGAHYDNNETVAGIPYNQAYVESTARAFLNNLERRDIGGDSYSISKEYYIPGAIPSVTTEKLYTSIGFSNSCYFVNGTEYFSRTNEAEYKNRPATRGFYDEAFSYNEKNMIVPKAIPGYTGHRWPNNSNNPQKMSYVEGAVDKVWLPSIAEINSAYLNSEYTNPSDYSSSIVFEYFKGKNGIFLENALRATRTELAKNSFAMNYSIPLYERNSTTANTNIHATNNSTDYYWTRSPASYNFNSVFTVGSADLVDWNNTNNSSIGVRPCVILKY